mmetsp:Transcript_6739/g.9294  ORF Transcript_6739/g.9294 Transcript_6739/m.9294 type:complete len:102 (-) Transcript_6739:255-560(-)
MMASLAIAGQMTRVHVPSWHLVGSVVLAMANMQPFETPSIPHVGERPNQKLSMQGMADAGPATCLGVQPRHPVEKLLLDGPRREEQQEMITKSLVYGLHHR